MAKIPLRIYTSEIERLIEKGNIQEALLHCQQILNFFPKHIETYRLLGKSFLDNKQYENAELVFNQLLSVFLDDFISHVGLSFIFEEKHDLSSAEEHMQRAFDIQPSNTTIQDELKRLYQKNTGTVLERIRLTRGALINMYDRSNLYTQAISEINLALQESPDSYDLRVKLAKMLSASGQKINAVDTSIKLVSQYPYCFEANRILTESLTDVYETQNINTYRQRLIELDPYYQYTSSEKPDVYSVTDAAVMLDHLDDLSSLQNNSEFNWNSFIRECWNTTSKKNPDTNQEVGISQNEIVEQHLQQKNSINSEDSETNIGKIKPEQSADIEKKQLSAEQPHEKVKEPLENQTFENIPTSDSPQSNSTIQTNSIPDWLLSEENQSRAQIPSNDSSQSNSAEQTNSIPDWLLPEEKQYSESKKSQPDKTSGPDHQINLSTDESGFVDDEVPVIPNPETDKTKPPSIWIKDEDKTKILDNKNDKPSKPEIAQRLEESPQYYDVVLKDAHDALLSGYPQRAIDSYKILLEKNVLVDKIIDQLEGDLVHFPQVFPLWLILGDAYHRQGLPQKALEIYQRAEQFISKGDHGQ